MPHGVDPLTSQDEGIFFVNHQDFLTCFYDFQIAHYRDNEGYTDDWYDKEYNQNEDTTAGSSTYEVTVPANNGDLYFSVDGYFQGMVPDSCWSGAYPIIRFTVYKNTQDVIVKNLYYYDAYHIPVQVTSGSYSAGDKFIMTVAYDWEYGSSSYPWKAQDYTLKIYSKENLEIKDADGKTNMWFMDGRYPSAFTKSHYRQETDRWTPTWQPRSLTDIWLVSNNFDQFWQLFT